MPRFAMITTARSAAYTAPALESFFRTTPLDPGDSMLLIDNDADYRLPESLARLPLEIHSNPEPLSFAANANFAASRALSAGDDLVLLNNDLIFTRSWFDPFRTHREAVMVPLSNGTMRYRLPIDAQGNEFALQMQMTLSDYAGHEDHLEQIAALHREREAAAPPLLPVLCQPFFAVRIPLAALRTVGGFETGYGSGGAEDYDYCLRCHLAGIPVAVARHSFLLHFGSLSFGQGVDSARTERERVFMTLFRERWGQRLFDLAFDDSPGAFERSGVTPEEIQRAGLKQLIANLAGERKPAIFLPLPVEQQR